jgi:hypothetical protein
VCTLPKKKKRKVAADLEVSACLGGACSRPSKGIRGAAAAASISTNTGTGVDAEGSASGSSSSSSSAGNSASASVAAHANGDGDGAPKPPSKFTAWPISAAVRDEVERLVAVCGDDCCCGSVEFLEQRSSSSDGNGSSSRVYFDVNLLSTLPMLDGSVADPDGLWPADEFDPWADLADMIAVKVKSGVGKCA